MTTVSSNSNPYYPPMVDRKPPTEEEQAGKILADLLKPKILQAPETLPDPTSAEDLEAAAQFYPPMEDRKPLTEEEQLAKALVKLLKPIILSAPEELPLPDIEE